MANKRLLFIEDLYDFYFNKYKRSTHFSSEKTGEPLVVQVHGNIKFDTSDKDKEGLLPVHLQSCHTDLNVNGSNINTSVMESALPSFKNRPILGYIHKVVTEENPEGQWEFYSHNMHEEDGEIVYDEYPIGLIPESCNAQLVYDEEKDKTYCEVDGYIYEEYSKAAEILQREQQCAVSVELSIRELSYDAKQKYLNIEDFFFSGVTILGKTPDGETVKPGMAGSNVKLADFSAQNNSLFNDYETKMIELQERLNKLESACFNKEQNTVQLQSKEGGANENMTKFEELLDKYNKTIEDITFDYSEMSDEELEAKFAELFSDENSDEDNSDEENSDTPSDDEVMEEDSDSDSSENDLDDSEDNSNGEENKNQEFEKLIRTFEISHEDIRYALYNLLSSYEESDNEWYFINAVYDDYFTYENWSGDKIFGQAYTKDGDNVSFDGERYNLHRELLTDSEYAELQTMRSNYAELKEFKANVEKNELHSKKEEIINSERYAVLAEKNESGEYVNADFAELIKSMDEYSIEDFETKVKVMHSDYLSSHSNFSSNKSNHKNTQVKLFANINKKSKPKKNYGNLFD